METSIKILFFSAIACCVFPHAFGQLHGSVSSNPIGGQDVNIALSKQFGQPDHNIGGGVFAAGNTKTGEAAHGGFLNANIKDHGLSLSKTYTPHSEITSQNARINLLNDDVNRLDTNLQHSNIKLNNGFDFDKYRGSLDYNHAAGHAASVGVSTIPKFGGHTVDVMGKANLWSSMDRATTLDATATGSRTFGGAFNGQKNFGAGLGLTHRF